MFILHLMKRLNNKSTGQHGYGLGLKVRLWLWLGLGLVLSLLRLIQIGHAPEQHLMQKTSSLTPLPENLSPFSS